MPGGVVSESPACVVVDTRSFFRLSNEEVVDFDSADVIRLIARGIGGMQHAATGVVVSAAERGWVETRRENISMLALANTNLKTRGEEEKIPMNHHSN